VTAKGLTICKIAKYTVAPKLKFSQISVSTLCTNRTHTQCLYQRLAS